MSLKQTISDEVKNAMRAKDSARLSTLRFLQAAIKQREVDERKDLSDAEVTAILEKQVKQRRESIAAPGLKDPLILGAIPPVRSLSVLRAEREGIMVGSWKRTPSVMSWCSASRERVLGTSFTTSAAGRWLTGCWGSSTVAS